MAEVTEIMAVPASSIDESAAGPSAATVSASSGAAGGAHNSGRPALRVLPSLAQGLTVFRDDAEMWYRCRRATRGEFIANFGRDKRLAKKKERVRLYILLEGGK